MKILMKSVLTGLAIFVFGFGAMYLFWVSGTYPGELPGLFSYYSSGIGDSIFLPLMGMGFTLFFHHADYRLTVKQKRWAAAFAFLGAVSGVLLQASWLINPDTGLNWTIPRAHHFNAAGWYHAVFLVDMFAWVAFSLARWWFTMRGMDTHSLPDVLINALVWGSGAGFVFTYAMDNFQLAVSGSELYLMDGVLVLFTAFFSIMAGTALLSGETRKMLSLYISLEVCFSAVVVSITYLCVHGGNMETTGVIISVAAFLLSFSYLKPAPDKMSAQLLKRVFIAVPAFTLTLALATYETVWQLAIIGIANIGIIALVADAQFHELIFHPQEDIEIVKINIFFGSVFMIALAGILYASRHSEYNDLGSMCISVIINYVGTRVIKKYFNNVKKYEESQSHVTAELEDIKKHVYVTLAALFFGAFIIVMLSLSQSADNLMELVFYFPGVNGRTAGYLAVLAASVLLILLYTVVLKRPQKNEGKRVMLLPVLFTVLLYGSLVCFLLEYTEPDFLLESMDCFTAAIYFSKLCMAFGIAFLIAEGFYTNAILVYSKANRVMTLLLSIVVGMATFLCNSIILFANKRQYALCNEGHHCTLLYLLVSVFLFSVFPAIVATFVNIVNEEAAVVLIEYRTCIFFDGFLYLLIFTFAGLIPDLINSLTDAIYVKVLLLISVFTLLVWILTYCMKNNVTHYNERKSTAMQTFGNGISDEDEQVVRVKFKYLRRHLRVQNLMSFVALLIYSGVYVFVFLISEYGQQNDDKDKSFGQVFASVRKRYWPGG